MGPETLVSFTRYGLGVAEPEFQQQLATVWLKVLHAADEADDAGVIEIWASDETRERIAGYLDRTVGRK